MLMVQALSLIYHCYGILTVVLLHRRGLSQGVGAIELCIRFDGKGVMLRWIFVSINFYDRGSNHCIHADGGSIENVCVSSV